MPEPTNSPTTGVQPATQPATGVQPVSGVQPGVPFQDLTKWATKAPEGETLISTAYRDKVTDDLKFVENKPGVHKPDPILVADNAPIIRGSALGGLNGEAKWEDKIMELMNAVDEYIPIPQRENEKPFLMPVEDVFSITGRGTVVTGRIETGVIHVGDPVEIVGLEEKTLTSTCTGVEMFRKLLDEGEAGDNVGLLLRGIDKKEVKRGMVVAKPGSITPHTKFQAEVYILKKEEGGRHTPFHNKYRPQFYLRTMDVTGEVTLPEGVDMVMPGDHVTITVELIYPVALNEGLRFAIREGGRTVGAGQILKILA